MSVPVREVRRDDNANRALRRIVRNHRGFEKTIKDALEHCARGGPSPTSGRTPGLEGKPEDRPRLPWNRKRRRRRQYATAIMNLSLRCCSVSSGTPNLRQSRNFATRCGDWKSWSHQATALGPDEWIEPAKRWCRHSVCLLRACWRARTAALPVSRSTRPLKRGVDSGLPVSTWRRRTEEVSEWHRHEPGGPRSLGMRSRTRRFIGLGAVSVAHGEPLPYRQPRTSEAATPAGSANRQGVIPVAGRQGGRYAAEHRTDRPVHERRENEPGIAPWSAG